MLRELDLCGLKRLTDGAVTPIPWRLRFLSWLSLTQCNGISDTFVNYLVETMPGLTVLDYYDTPHGAGAETRPFTCYAESAVEFDEYGD